MNFTYTISSVFSGKSLELFIKDVNTQTLLEIAQLCDEVSNFLLVLNLTLQELTLDEVSQLGVSMGVSNFVHLKQRLKENIGNFDLMVILR